MYRDNGKENGDYYLRFRVQGLGIRVYVLLFWVWDFGRSRDLTSKTASSQILWNLEGSPLEIEPVWQVAK